MIGKIISFYELEKGVIWLLLIATISHPHPNELDYVEKPKK